MQKVIADYRDLNVNINFSDYFTKTRNLDDFIDEIKGIRTSGKWSTWGREYVEIPPQVLEHFGVNCNHPLVSYRNYVYFNPYDYVYAGEIFQGDAAWFDYYTDLSKQAILNSPSYKTIKKALENSNSEKEFLDFFHTRKAKWNTVPVWNEELAKIAIEKDTSLK